MSLPSIYFTSRFEVKNYFETVKNFISISTPYVPDELPIEWPTGANVLFLVFDDHKEHETVTNVLMGEAGTLRLTEVPVVRYDGLVALEVIEFARACAARGEDLVVQCRMGQSRSAGIALALVERGVFQLGFAEDEADTSFMNQHVFDCTRRVFDDVQGEQVVWHTLDMATSEPSTHQANLAMVARFSKAMGSAVPGSRVLIVESKRNGTVLVVSHRQMYRDKFEHVLASDWGAYRLTYLEAPNGQPS